MPFNCEIHPRADLSPEECKTLGNSIHQWLYSDPANRWVDWFGMDDLRGGELPQPWYLRKMTQIEGRGLPEDQIGKPGIPIVKTLSIEEREEFKKKLGDLVSSRHVPLSVFHTSDFDFVVESLREHIPADLVVDVTIDGESWNAD